VNGAEEERMEVPRHLLETRTFETKTGTIRIKASIF
jgi:hypothetical protein